MSPRSIGLGLRRLLRKERAERELADEVDHYLEMATREHVRAGLSRADAERRARIDFGGIEAQKERVRRGGWESFVETLLQDAGYAIRGLRRNPGFTAIAVLMLGLGIGSNSALFSVADEVFLRSLPVHHPEELVLFQWTSGPQWIGGTIAGMSVDPVTGALGSTAFSKLTFDRFRSETRTLSSVFAFTRMDAVTLSDSETALGQLVSGSYFTGLGVRPAAGRLFVPDDDRETAPLVAVISYRFWQRRFGLKPDAVGKSLNVVTRTGPSSFTIVGVTPPGFAGTQELGNSPDISVPLAGARSLGFEGKARFDTPWYWPIRVMGRMRPGVTQAQVRAELQSVLQATALEGWSAMPRHRPNPDIPRLAVTPGGKGLVDARRGLTRVVQIMAVIVVLVLLIVCTNLANLLLARTATRQRELAVRAAIGARRGRLVRQLLSESAVLSFAGGALGVAVAYWGKDLFLAWIHRTNAWFTLEPRLDLRVLGFTLAMSLITGLVVGVIPALRATRIDLTQSIKEGSPTAGGRRSYVSRSLVIAQIAISIVLMIGAGLFLRTVRNLRSADVGFDKKNLLLFSGVPRGNFSVKTSEAAVLVAYDGFLQQLDALPGVRRATYSQYPLLSGDFAMPFLYVPGRTPLAGEDRTVYLQQVHPTFFETMGMPVILGRGLTTEDRVGSPVLVVNESLARKYFPDGSALGRRIGITKTPTTSQMADSELVEIVGVVRDAKFTNVRQDAPATAFGSTRAGRVTFELRTSVNPTSLIPQVRALAQTSGFALEDYRTQEAAAAQTFAEERHFALLTSLFGVLATVLACLGLYGLMSYQVTRRTHEIGVRMALGARRGRVVRMVLSETMVMAVVGVIVGVVAALGFTRFVASLLYGLSWNDASTLGMAAVLMVGVTALAGLIPGWRATKVDPLVALRHE